MPYLNPGEIEFVKPVYRGWQLTLPFEGERVELVLFNHYTREHRVRKGRLETDGKWAYLYDKGRSGQSYNCAFIFTEEKIVSIKPLKPSRKKYSNPLRSHYSERKSFPAHKMIPKLGYHTTFDKKMHTKKQRSYNNNIENFI